MIARAWLLLAGLGVALAQSSCSKPAAENVMTLYSIDGSRSTESKKWNGPRHHGFPLLGKVEIWDVETQSQVLRSWDKGLAAEGSVHDCFWPRHALSFTRDGATHDLVICFQCENYSDGQRINLHVGKEPQALFNRLLSDAGVPLAK